MSALGDSYPKAALLQDAAEGLSPDYVPRLSSSGASPSLAAAADSDLGGKELGPKPLQLPRPMSLSISSVRSTTASLSTRFFGGTASNAPSSNPLPMITESATVSTTANPVAGSGTFAMKQASEPELLGAISESEEAEETAPKNARSGRARGRTVGFAPAPVVNGTLSSDPPPENGKLFTPHNVPLEPGGVHKGSNGASDGTDL